MKKTKRKKNLELLKQVLKASEAYSKTTGISLADSVLFVLQGLIEGLKLPSEKK